MRFSWWYTLAGLLTSYHRCSLNIRADLILGNATRARSACFYYLEIIQKICSTSHCLCIIIPMSARERCAMLWGNETKFRKKDKLYALSELAQHTHKNIREKKQRTLRTFSLNLCKPKCERLRFGTLSGNKWQCERKKFNFRLHFNGFSFRIALYLERRAKTTYGKLQLRMPLCVCIGVIPDRRIILHACFTHKKAKSLSPFFALYAAKNN